MDRDRLTSVAVALLSVVVVGVAAATLGETTRRSGDVGTGDGSSGLLPSRTDVVASEPTPFPDVLWLASALVVLFALLFLVGAVLYPRETLKRTVAGGVVTAVVVGAGWLLAQLFGDSVSPEESGRPQRTPESDGVVPNDGGGAGGIGELVNEPVAVELLVVGVLGVAVLGVLAHRSRSADEERTSGPEGATLAAIGRSAGRAADRIADADARLDNEVYRAWKEMTGHLDLDDPAARTPEEFRAAALEAGMAGDDVAALTDLFREVRYGGARPTEDREAAAADALRRIEERYTAEEGP